MFGLMSRGEMDKWHAEDRVLGFTSPRGPLDANVIVFEQGWNAGLEWARREREYMLFYRWLRTEREAIRAALL